MMKCWNQLVSKRPTFSMLKQQLTEMYEQHAVNCVYVDQMIENAFDIISSQPGEKCWTTTEGGRSSISVFLGGNPYQVCQ